MRQRGFTLLELLIVIGIIGVMAAIVIAALEDSRRSARNEAVVGQMAEYQKSLELYYSDFRSYPRTNPAGTAIYCIGDGIAENTVCMNSISSPGGYSSANSAPVEAAFRTYMPDLPRFEQPRGSLVYSSPAYSGCSGVGMANTSCTPGDYSIWFILEGTNENCGRAYVADANVENEYTLCRLSAL